MKAIILAAGYATRLYPLTQNKAKPLLEVHGKPIIDYILQNLNDCEEVEDIYVVTNNKFYTDFLAWKENIKNRKITTKNLEVVNDKTAENGTRLGAIGDINFIIQQKKIHDDLLVIAGDNLFSFRLNGLIGFYRQKHATIVAVYDTGDKFRIANRLGCVEIDSAGKITNFEEKPLHPKTTLAATACYIFPREDLHFIAKALTEKHFDRPGDLIKFIAEKKPVYGFEFSGYWFDVGTHEEYALVNDRNTKLF